MAPTGLTPLPASADDDARTARYAELRLRIGGILEDEDDWTAAMATLACELHHGFAYFHWTGFYRLVRPERLVIGPYQGGHGCLRIDLDRGVCGAAVRAGAAQRVDDVAARPDHIACAASTRSELVVPVFGDAGRILGVLDVDSDLPAAFTAADEAGLTAICADLGHRFAGLPAQRL